MGRARLRAYTFDEAKRIANKLQLTPGQYPSVSAIKKAGAITFLRSMKSALDSRVEHETQRAGLMVLLADLRGQDVAPFLEAARIEAGLSKPDKHDPFEDDHLGQRRAFDMRINRVRRTLLNALEP